MERIESHSIASLGEIASHNREKRSGRESRDICDNYLDDCRSLSTTKGTDSEVWTSDLGSKGLIT